MKTSVLVVDENPALARSLQILMEDERACLVRIATNRKQAFEALESDEAPDLLVSDISTLDTFGVRFLDRLRSRNAEVTIVLMTAHPATVTSSDCQALGISEVLVKPIDPEIILRLVDR